MTKLLIPTVLGLLVVPLLGPASVGATETYHFSARGEFADASFRGIDPSGCVETIAQVAAVDRLVKESGSPTVTDAWALVRISQHDLCTATPMIAATGFAELFPEALDVTKLDAATLNTSIVVDDAVSGSSFTVDVDLAWQATAAPVRYQEHVLIQEPSGMVNARVQCTGALCLGVAATVTGSITDETSDFTPEPGSGALGSAKEARVVVDRG